ncbi:MAG: prepilin-type N-terminal cleavage/methylation domain-containing protein [Planctomycetes bacterium]|jgi:prepilin-type N-terminal cleavage/methylation domain-containing protein|nr:prepilin-type N-terminal cleavage/methylation domain-containing protein [Planctomycetota bacterium]
MARRAFTLIELMIAISLSMVIVYTAFAAFRVASQAVATSKRMSIENGMMRTGFFAALDELDFWDLYDDRNAANPTTNPLRVTGKPFCPVTWDPTKKPSDPKSWWRGFGFSTDVANANKWGNYSLLSRAGHSDAVRAWYPNQIKNINEKMGGYAMISYLPGDAIYCWYESGGSPFTIKGEPRDVWERTSYTPVTVNSLTYDKGQRGDFLPSRPAHWPGLAVETRRYVVWSSFIDLCQVEVTSPVSGETTRLSFWGVGTTLRGARQQRDLDTVAIR